MDPSAPLPPAKSYAERIAWMHEPVHLRCVLLPWFVVRWLEQELHSFFCNLERHLLELLELHRQGKLEPWPEAPADAPEDEPAPRLSAVDMRSPPAARRRSAGCSAVPPAPQARSAPALAGEAAGAMAMLGVPWLATALCQQQPQAQLIGRWSEAPLHRCQKTTFWKPAWAGWDNCV